MNKQETLSRISELGVIAVIRGPSAELTMKMAEALLGGGVRGIEITYTTPDAADVVRELRQAYGGEILLGMGTLTAPAHASEALEAGASFIVSPHTEESLAVAMRDTDLVVMMGALTPSEMMRSLRFGSDVVKLFPGSLVGPEYLRALRGPFPDLQVMPTGGVGLDNLAAWFEAGAFAVGAGSSLCPRSWAEQGRFTDISRRAEEFIELVERVRSST